MPALKTRKSDLQLLDALTDLVDDNDLDRLSTRLLIKRAGLSKSTFYRHYEDKYAFYDWAMAYLLGKDNEPTYHLETPRSFYTKYFEHYQTYRKAFKAFIINDRWSGFTQKMVDSGMANYRAILAKINQPNVPITTVSAYIISAHIGVAVNWIRTDDPTPPQEMAAQLTQLTTAVLSSYGLDFATLFKLA